MSALEPLASPASSDCRCLCGSLVARRVDGGVELKCRRCKRVLLVPWDESVPISDGTPAPPSPRRGVDGRESRT